MLATLTRATKSLRAELLEGQYWDVAWDTLKSASHLPDELPPASHVWVVRSRHNVLKETAAKGLRGAMLNEISQVEPDPRGIQFGLVADSRVAGPNSLQVVTLCPGKNSAYRVINMLKVLNFRAFEENNGLVKIVTPLKSFIG